MKRLSLPKPQSRVPDQRAVARAERGPIVQPPQKQAGSRVSRSLARDTRAVASGTREKVAAQPAVHEPDEGPQNIDQFRRDMARRIHQFVSNREGLWLSCPEAACRRHRACAAPHGACTNAKPRKPLTEQQQAQAMAEVQRMLREELARRGIEP